MWNRQNGRAYAGPYANPLALTPMLSNCRIVIAVKGPKQSEQSVGSALAEAGMRVDYVSEEALADALDDLRPDLLVWRAGPGNRLKRCQQIKQAKGDSLPLIVIFAADDTDPDRFNTWLEQSGANDWITLPARPQEIVCRVQRWVARRDQALAMAQHQYELTLKLAATETDLRSALDSSRAVMLLRETIIRNVSHELRTPRLQMKSAVLSLDKHLRDQLVEPKAAKLLDYATQSTMRLDELVNNISQMASAFSLRIAPFAIHDAATICLQRLQRSWAYTPKVNRVQINIAEDLPYVLADRNGIVMVLYQLVENGLKFSADQTPVCISAEATESGLMVAVRDSGIGIPAHRQSEIFQVFGQLTQQANGQTEASIRDDRPPNGVGVGLSIVKMILDTLGIPVHLESTEGMGSIFWFVLPYAP
jgi:K+-sensing histidine kinase KdpD